MIHPTIESTLGKIASDVKPRDAGWDFTLKNGCVVPAHAELESDWLTLRAAPQEVRRRPSAWRLLELNGTLAGGARVSSTPAGRLALGASIPSEHAHDTLKATCDGLLAGAGWLAGSTKTDRNKSNGQQTDGDASDMSEALRSGGWTVTDDGSIDLDGDAMATIAHGRVTARLFGEDEVPAKARAAVGLLGLALNHVVRGVRVARVDGAVVLEADVHRRPAAVFTMCALQAVYVAVRLGAFELRALRDKDCARAFLDVRGEKLSGFEQGLRK